MCVNKSFLSLSPPEPVLMTF
ncbi:unnamed protein product [Ophioblennius macclurei]